MLSAFADFRLLTLSFLLSTLVNGVPASKRVVPPLPTTFTLTGDVEVFSLKLIDAFPFIGGAVNGQAGQFMFDTGNPDKVDLNSHWLKLPPGRALGQDQVGSGQHYTRTLVDTIASITLSNGLVYRKVPDVEANTFDFLEHIAPDCLGQIGFAYFDGYSFKLDYTQRLLTCYRQTEARRASQDFLRGEHVLGVLNYEVRKRPGTPLIKVKIGPYDFLCEFDTGQQGKAVLSPAVRRVLLAKKLLVPLSNQGTDTLYTLRQVGFGPGLKVDLHAIDVVATRNEGVDRALGLTNEPHVLSVGYAFLSQFTTVWDTQAHKIYLCRPK